MSKNREKNANEKIETLKKIQIETHVFKWVFLATFFIGSSSSSMTIDYVGVCTLGCWADSVQSGAIMALKTQDSASCTTSWWPLFKHAWAKAPANIIAVYFNMIDLEFFLNKCT